MSLANSFLFCFLQGPLFINNSQTSLYTPVIKLIAYILHQLVDVDIKLHFRFSAPYSGQ